MEGPQAVRELLKFRPDDVVDVYLTDEVESRDRELALLAREATRWVHPVTAEVAKAISPDCQGVAAVAEVRAVGQDPSGLWSSLRKVAPGGTRPFVVCLPQTQDPGNLGTIIRSADAMGAEAVILGRGTVEPANPKVIRSSAGSVFHLPIVRASLSEAREQLAGRSWSFLATAGRGADLVLDDLVTPSHIRARTCAEDREPPSPQGDGALAGADLVLAGPHVWVFGNEAHGLDRDDLALCDFTVGIPIAGKAESLNAAAAAAMCLYASHLVG